MANSPDLGYEGWTEPALSLRRIGMRDLTEHVAWTKLSIAPTVGGGRIRTGFAALAAAQGTGGLTIGRSTARGQGRDRENLAPCARTAPHAHVGQALARLGLDG